MKNYKKININNLVNYFESGCKKTNSGKIGLELEHFIVYKDTHKAVPYYGDKGVEAILNALIPHFKSYTYSDNHLLGLSNDEYSITLEPAAQLEVSIVPKTSLVEIQAIYNSFISLIEPILNNLNYCLVNSGYQPASKVDDLPLIPKERYRVMDDFFSISGLMGRNMMRGTASAQVNIDYYSQEDFIKKYKLAYLLTPIIYLITDNVSVFEGKENKISCKRLDIWQNVDKKRCDVPHKTNLDDFKFLDYAEYIYNSLPLFKSDGSIVSYTMTNNDYYSDIEITNADIEHMLSMVFPDVRLKQFIEIRCADSMPLKYTMSYIALIKGLFYGNNSVDSALLKFEKSSLEDLKNALNSVKQYGFNSEIFGVKTNTLIKYLFNIAKKNLSIQDIEFLLPLEQMACNSTNLRAKKGSVSNEKL